MKTNPARLRAAFALALRAILGTLALAVLLWLRVSILRYRTVPFLMLLWVFDLAFRPSWFQAALYTLLAFNLACCAGAAWLALRRR